MRKRKIGFALSALAVVLVLGMAFAAANALAQQSAPSDRPSGESFHQEHNADPGMTDHGEMMDHDKKGDRGRMMDHGMQCCPDCPMMGDGKHSPPGEQ